MITIRKFLHPKAGVIFMFFLMIFAAFQTNAQTFHYNRTIQWKPVQEVKISPSDSFRVLSFENSSRIEDEFGRLPLFFERIRSDQDPGSVVSVKIDNPVFEPIDPVDLVRVNDLDKVTSSFESRGFISTQKKKSFLNAIVLPDSKKQSERHL